MSNSIKMSATIGRSFEELDEAEMMAISGGSPLSVSTVTTWSTAPCTIGALTVTVVASIAGTIIYTVTH